MKLGLLIAMFLLPMGAFAHEHAGKHAASVDECKSMAKGAKEKKCEACVQPGGHHFHLGKMKGQRCHDDSHDPMMEKK